MASSRSVAVTDFAGGTRVLAPHWPPASSVPRREALAESGELSEGVEQRLSGVLGGGATTEVGCDRLAGLEHRGDRAHNAVGGGLFAEVLEHQRACPYGADRVRDPLAGDVRGGAV